MLVDATQGIQAQTISNLYLAIENDLEIIPVINKIDMDGAMVDEVKDQILELIGCKPEDILLASAKTGEGVAENHNWYIVAAHMNAKDRPIIAPPTMTTQANG